MPQSRLVFFATSLDSRPWLDADTRYDTQQAHRVDIAPTHTPLMHSHTCISNMRGSSRGKKRVWDQVGSSSALEWPLRHTPSFTSLPHKLLHPGKPLAPLLFVSIRCCLELGTEEGPVLQGSVPSELCRLSSSHFASRTASSSRCPVVGSIHRHNHQIAQVVHIPCLVAPWLRMRRKPESSRASYDSVHANLAVHQRHWRVPCMRTVQSCSNEYGLPVPVP